MLGYYFNSHSPDQECPRCSGTVIRVKRHWIDRLISAAFAPVHRYRCEQLGCSWEGRLKVAQNQRRIEPLLYWLTNDRLRRGQGPDAILNDPKSSDD